MKVFQNLLGRKSKEAYHFYFKLIELCSSESSEGQTEFTFHENTLRVLWETNAQGVREVCSHLTLSALCVCTHHASHVNALFVNLPKYLGSYSTKEKKEKEKKVNILEASLLSFLFDAEDEIQKWLLTGTESSQKELLEKHSHHVLAEEIRKAFLWQFEKSPRKAGTFLVTWLSNKKSAAFMPRKAHTTKSAVTTDNPTGNPYKNELSEIRSEGKVS
jgi:translation elongation factor EF-G